MARVKGAMIEEASQEMREVFAEQEKRYGFVTNTTRVYALRPTNYKGIQALAAGILASGLIEPELRHLVCVKAAGINGCPF